jgi:hypothetical protein
VEQRNQIETTGVINITEQEQLCKHDFAGWFLDPKGKIPIKISRETDLQILDSIQYQLVPDSKRSFYRQLAKQTKRYNDVIVPSDP